MSDEDKKPGIDQISSFIEKNGISTLLLVAGIYVGYTSFLKPAGDKYVAMLDAVTESNVSLTATIAELKTGMIEIGQRNATRGEQAADSLQDIEQHLRELETISRNIESKLGELRQPRYLPRPEPVEAPVEP
jgi:hypothetical protein